MTSPFADPPESKRKQWTSHRYVYTYHLSIGTAPMEFIVAVEPVVNRANHYAFSLFVRAFPVERQICEPVTLKLTVNPRKLHFRVFVFPPKSSLPVGCLHNLRVWVHSKGVDHRLFADDDFWIGRDPDFHSIANASFAKLLSVSRDTHLYQGMVGKAYVNFFVRWSILEEDVYNISLEYEAGGIGCILMDSCRIRLECDLTAVTFVIYSVPLSSTPAGASHRLRLWLCTVLPPPSSPEPPSSGNSVAESYLCQRLYKSDSFKLGAALDFDEIGNKMIMGFREVGTPNPLVIPLQRVDDGDDEDELYYAGVGIQN